MNEDNARSWLAYNRETDRVDWKQTLANLETEIDARAKREGWRPSEAAAAVAHLKLVVIPKMRRRYYYLRRRMRR